VDQEVVGSSPISHPDIKGDQMLVSLVDSCGGRLN
jgi:hypothetical protein